MRDRAALEYVTPKTTLQRNAITNTFEKFFHLNLSQNGNSSTMFPKRRSQTNTTTILGLQSPVPAIDTLWANSNVPLLIRTFPRFDEACTCQHRLWTRRTPAASREAQLLVLLLHQSCPRARSGCRRSLCLTPTLHRVLLNWSLTLCLKVVNTMRPISLRQRPFSRCELNTKLDFVGLRGFNARE